MEQTKVLYGVTVTDEYGTESRSFYGPPGLADKHVCAEPPGENPLDPRTLQVIKALQLSYGPPARVASIVIYEIDVAKAPHVTIKPEDDDAPRSSQALALAILDREFDRGERIAVSWTAGDVLTRYPGLSREAAKRVLRSVYRDHHPKNATAWLPIEATARRLYPEKM